ncbi:MAG: DUF362 domain-containing protein, partial [Candidatus Aminicenantes bacterium]|nr:DUF362 domain-containing protein [Candidatus Aminicenantes bacterium]
VRIEEVSVMISNRSISRRGFLAAGGGFVGLLSAVASSGGAAFAASGAGPAARPAPGTTTVALVRTPDRADGVRRSLALLGVNPVRGKRVLVKPNFNTSDPTPGSTHNDTLRALLAELKGMGAASLAVGDRSGPEDTEKVLTKKGIPALAAEFGAGVLNFDGLGPDGYVKVAPPGSHWADGFLVARPVVEAEAVVSACCLKTHQYGGIFTMSLKNSVGIVPREGYAYMRELHGSPHQRRMIAEINAAYAPVLIVLDGVEAFTDGGPMTGTLKTAEVVLAGTDRVAIDAVGLAVLKELGSNAAIMGTKIFAQEQIARAVELGLGVDGPERIVIKTADAAGEAYAEKIRTILAAG